MKLLKRLLAAIGVLILVAGAGTLWLLARGGAFRDIQPHFAGTCESVPLEGSGEDIVVDRDRGFAYLSLLDRQALVKGGAAQGTVALLDLNVKPYSAVDALVSKPEHFRPHGMSLYVDANGQRYLAIINHPVNRGSEPEAVEFFVESAPGRFAHTDTVRDPLFNSPNDLAAVAPRQFYLANDKAVGGAVPAALQQAGFGASPLVFFDGVQANVVADDIASGGGINVSADGRTLYVSETAGQRLRVFDRDAPGAGITERSRIPLPTSPDNIDVGADGNLTVTGHANTLALVRHFVSGSPAPTQVLEVRFDTAGGTTVQELYLDDGSHISAGSVGATYRDKLVIGSITAKKVLVCERSGPARPM